MCQRAKAPGEGRALHKGMAAIHPPRRNDFSNAYNLKHANERFPSPCSIRVIGPCLDVITWHMATIMLFTWFC